MTKTLNTRSCLPCTACCEGWLDVQGPVANAKLGLACQHCSNAGCDIYASRPNHPCRDFACAWRQQDTPLPDDMRPDVCGAIVMFDHLTWLGEGVIVAVATGTDMPQATFDWLQGLAALWQKNLLTLEFEQDSNGYTGGYQLRMLGPEAFKQDMVAHFKRIDAQQLLRRRQETVFQLHWARPVSLSVRHHPAASASLLPSAR
jgi:hypothetical protein